eukprot:9420172-Pyramimonas_sp.AAC.1
MIIRSHGVALRSAEMPGEPLGKLATSDEITKKVLELLHENGDGEDNPGNEAIAEEISKLSMSVPAIGVLKRMAEDQTFVKAFLSFLSQNLSSLTPCGLQPACRELSDKTAVAVACALRGGIADDAAKVRIVCDAIAVELFKAVPTRWIEFASHVQGALDSKSFQNEPEDKTSVLSFK